MVWGLSWRECDRSPRARFRFVPCGPRRRLWLDWRRLPVRGTQQRLLSQPGLLVSLPRFPRCASHRSAVIRTVVRIVVIIKIGRSTNAFPLENRQPDRTQRATLGRSQRQILSPAQAARSFSVLEPTRPKQWRRDVRLNGRDLTAAENPFLPLSYQILPQTGAYMRFLLFCLKRDLSKWQRVSEL